MFDLILQAFFQLTACVVQHDPKSPKFKNLTVVMFAPNAGNIGHTLPLVEAIYNKLGYNVVTYSYRGYGLSTGTADEKGLKIDAQTVLRYLADDPIIGKTKLVLYGRSLGGAVAIYTATLPAAANFVSGIILENTFLSIPKLLPSVIPLLKFFKFLVTQKWDSEKNILDVPKNIKLLFLSGAADDLVPPEQHKMLFDLAPCTQKFFKSLPNGTHNDTVMQDGYWLDFNKFCVICETGALVDSLDDNDEEDEEGDSNLDSEAAALAAAQGMSDEELARLVGDDPSMKPGPGEKLSWIPVSDTDAVKAASITNIKDVI